LTLGFSAFSRDRLGRLGTGGEEARGDILKFSANAGGNTIPRDSATAGAGAEDAGDEPSDTPERAAVNSAVFLFAAVLLGSLILFSLFLRFPIITSLSTPSSAAPILGLIYLPSVLPFAHLILLFPDILT